MVTEEEGIGWNGGKGNWSKSKRGERENDKQGKEEKRGDKESSNTKGRDRETDTIRERQTLEGEGTMEGERTEGKVKDKRGTEVGSEKMRKG